MSTASYQHQEVITVNVGTKSGSKIKTGSFTEFIKQAEEARFTVIPMLLALIACAGGIAAAFGVQKSEFDLAITVASTGLVEVLILSLVSMRVILAASLLAVLVDLAVILL